jgi:carboxymethylenebutenolidase
MTIIMALLTLAQDVEGSTVKYKSGDDEVSAFLVKPKGDGPFPGVIVIQEWWGLNDQIKGVGERLAKQGYAALCVDLYRGTVTKDPGEAHELMRGLPEDRAMHDLHAAFAYLKDTLKCKKIGSVGFCMGGGYSLSLALEEPTLSACVVYYGRLLTDKGKLAKINAPILGFFGDQDRGIPVSDVRKFEAAMKDLKKDVTIHVYEGAGHAFFNESGKQYNKDAAEDSSKKMVEFFKSHLN